MINKEENLCKEIEKIRFDIGLSVYFWLHQEGIGWDYLQCNPSYGGDVWEEIAYVLEHHPDRFPDYVMELVAQAVQDLCLQVTPDRLALEGIWEELRLLKKGGVYRERNVKRFRLTRKIIKRIFPKIEDSSPCIYKSHERG